MTGRNSLRIYKKLLLQNNEFVNLDNLIEKDYKMGVSARMKAPLSCHYNNEQIAHACYFSEGVIRLNKKSLIFPVSALLSLGLAGCGTNDESAVQDRYNDSTKPVGYYSNENHRNGGGNARMLDGADNDGPVTEMMDHTFGSEGQYESNNQRNQKVGSSGDNPLNVATPVKDDTRELSQGDELFSRSDENYHAHLGDNDRKARSSYYEGYEGNLVEKINLTAANINNVKDVQTVLNGNNVIIAATLKDTSREEATKTEISRAIQPYLNGRTSYVVTDEGTLSRLRYIDNDLRNGGPKGQTYLDIKNLLYE